MSFASKISNYYLKCMSYVQSIRDYGLSIYGDEILRELGIVCARIICNNYDYINTRCIDLVKSLKLQTISDTIFCVFWCSNVYMALHLATCPMMLLWLSTSMVTIQGENVDLYVPRRTKELCKRSFSCKVSMLWNDLPDILKESSLSHVFKSNYHFIIAWQISEYIWVYLSIMIKKCLW